VTDALYASIFVEMQCTGNQITANRVVQTGANPYQTCSGIHVDSYLNTVVANDFGSSGMCVSGLPQGSVYPPALSNRFVDNIAPVLDLGSSGRSGCGNYGAENKAPNGSYAVVEDFFTVVNRERHIPVRPCPCGASVLLAYTPCFCPPCLHSLLLLTRPWWGGPRSSIGRCASTPAPPITTSLIGPS